MSLVIVGAFFVMNLVLGVLSGQFAREVSDSNRGTRDDTNQLAKRTAHWEKREKQLARKTTQWEKKRDNKRRERLRKTSDRTGTGEKDECKEKKRHKGGSEKDNTLAEEKMRRK